MSVTPIRRVTDAELLALTLRGFGYVDADEIMELDECIWELAADITRVPVPNTATRTAVWDSFGQQVGEPSGPPERESSAGPRSSLTASEPVDLLHRGHGTSTGSTTERRNT